MSIEKLKSKKTIIEGMLVGCFYKNPYLIYDYVLNKDFMGADMKFYYALGEHLIGMGHNVFDEVTIYSLINDNEVLKNGFDRRGGFEAIKELTSIVDIENTDSYVDQFNKYCLLEQLHSKGFNIEKDWDKFERKTASDVFNYFEYQLNSIDLDVTADYESEFLDITDEFIQDLQDGVDVGLNYGKNLPIMNYLTLGLPKGDLTAVCSFTNGGKTSFIMENMVIPISEGGKRVVIISNEQQSKVYKLLLIVHVLTHKLNYWKLTRKKLKSGNWTYEDKVKIQEAKDIINEQYAKNIKFYKTFDYNMSKVTKIVKKEAKVGAELIVYDTMKASTDNSDAIWLSLLKDSKELFQVISKENVAGVVALQLALGQENKRFLNTSTLANGKQISEIFSEMWMFRDLWDDEFTDQKFDCKPYKFIRGSDGKFTSSKEMIVLDPTKKYKVAFLAKTRNDEAEQCILLQFDGAWNRWIEIGYCNIKHDRY